MDTSKFAEVDFFSAFIYLGVAGILLVFSVPLLMHGAFRRHKFSKLSQGYQTYQTRASIRNELIVGWAILAAMLGFLLASYFTYTTSAQNLHDNIQQQYQPTELSVGVWNGSWATVDLQLPDGTRFTDSIVTLRAGYEPFIEDVWYHYNPKPNG